MAIQSFSNIPIRGNGEEITKEWFNSLRDAGITLGLLAGVNEISETIQNGAVDVALDLGTPEDFDADDYQSFLFDFSIRRSTSLETRFCNGQIACQFVGSAWRIREGISIGDQHGLTWSVATAAGNLLTLKYDSDTMDGTGYTGTIKLLATGFTQ